MDADKTSKALGSETKVFMPHSTADEHQHVDISCPWHPKSHKGEMEGPVSWRSGLLYWKQWARLFFMLERVPQGYLGQKQGWEMAQVKSSQGLVFLETCNKTCSNTCRSKICRSGRRLFQPPSCPTEFTKIFLKTCSSVSSLGTPVTQSTNWQFSQASSYYLFLSELTTKLVSCGYCNKLP